MVNVKRQSNQRFQSKLFAILAVLAVLLYNISCSIDSIYSTIPPPTEFSSTQNVLIHDNPTSISTSPPINNKASLTVIVPGFGNIDRLPTMTKSIKTIQGWFSAEEGYGFHCIIYVYKDEVIFEAKRNLPFCEVHYSVGLWTHHMSKVPSPPTSDTTHVAMLMDDIDIYTHSSNNIISLLNQMSKLNYNVMAAAAPNHRVYNESMHPRKECVSHETGFSDVLFTVYDAQAWACWQSQIDLDMNPSGWGYDLTFSDVCGVKVGVMDDFVLVHDDPFERTYELTSALEEMHNYIDHVAEVYEKKHNKTLPNYELLKNQPRFKTKSEVFKRTVPERVRKFQRCDEMND